MALQDMIDSFNEINAEIEEEKEGSSIPLVAANYEYYKECLDTLEYSEEERTEFLEWLETQHGEI